MSPRPQGLRSEPMRGHRVATAAAQIIWALSTAGFAARCLHVVSELGVADRIGDEQRTAPLGGGQLISPQARALIRTSDI